MIINLIICWSIKWCSGSWARLTCEPPESGIRQTWRTYGYSSWVSGILGIVGIVGIAEIAEIVGIVSIAQVQLILDKSTTPTYSSSSSWWYLRRIVRTRHTSVLQVVEGAQSYGRQVGKVQKTVRNFSTKSATTTEEQVVVVVPASWLISLALWIVWKIKRTRESRMSLNVIIMNESWWDCIRIVENNMSVCLSISISRAEGAKRA